MAEISVQTVDNDGAEITWKTTNSGGDSFPNSDRTVLLVKNGDTSAHTITVAVQNSNLEKEGYGIVELSDISFQVGADKEGVVNVPTASHTDSSGLAQVTYDAAPSSLEIAALKI